MLHIVTQRRRHFEKSVITVMYRLMCLSYLTTGFDFRAMLSLTKACNVFSFSAYNADLYHTTGSMGYIQLYPVVWRSVSRKQIH
jgi:hypothetical protein